MKNEIYLVVLHSITPKTAITIHRMRSSPSQIPEISALCFYSVAGLCNAASPWISLHPKMLSCSSNPLYIQKGRRATWTGGPKKLGNTLLHKPSVFVNSF